MTLSAEHAEAGGKRHRRGILTSWTQLGVPAGNLVAVAALTAASTALPDEAFLSWGWRLPFLAIVDTVAEILSGAPDFDEPGTVDDVLAAEHWARTRAHELIKEKGA